MDDTVGLPHLPVASLPCVMPYEPLVPFGLWYFLERDIIIRNGIRTTRHARTGRAVAAIGSTSVLGTITTLVVVPAPEELEI